MSRIRTFPMPDVGEGLTEAEILAWHVAVGDTVTVNQIVVEIETAKAAVELPSPYAGTVTALLVEPGITVNVGTPIISVDTEPGAASADDGAGSTNGGGGPAGAGVGPGDETAGRVDDAGPGASAFDGAGPGPDGVDPVARRDADTDGGGAKIGEMMADGRIATLVGYVSAEATGGRRPRRAAVVSDADRLTSPEAEQTGPAPKAAPQLRKLAKDLGVDLWAVSPARADGVISRGEIQAAAGGGASTVESDHGSDEGRERRVPVKGLRKLTAQAMVASAFSAPHVTEFLTVDVTPMMQLRDRLRLRPEFAELKLSPLAFAAFAVCVASRRTPEINSVWDGDRGEIVFKEYVHLGIAAATPRGLIVPVIRDADRLNLRGLAVALADLTATARSGRTAPGEMTGGTVTITNVGVFGVDTGTPIINPGESAILALGSIRDAPWVVDGQLAVRKVCQLAVSFDHRVIDGQQGSQFLADVGALLADPALALAY